MTKNLFLFILFMHLMGCLGFAQNYKISSEFFFKTDSSALSPGEYEKLRSFLNKNTDTLEISTIFISAWCDDVARVTYNQILSEKRAEHIKHLLMGLSVSETLIDTEAKGEVALLSNENIEQSRANNRRANVTVTYLIKQKEIIIEKQKEKPIEKTFPTLSDNQKVGDKITLEKILFIGGRHVLLPESFDELEALTATLLQKTKYHILILGHICCIGPGDDGLDFDTGAYDLSTARAKAIYQYLVTHGVAAERLKYKGLKGDYPTGKGDKQDRRVEIEITKIVNE